MNIYNRQGAMFGAMVLLVTLVGTIVGPVGVWGESNSFNSEKIDLNINSTFSLNITDYMEFDRIFSLSQKQEISLIHIRCQSSQNSVKQVLIGITLNGVETSAIFEDSSSNYNSPHTFFAGTTLTLQIDSSNPLYVLSNSLKLEITVETKSIFNLEVGEFTIDEVIFETITPPTITAASENAPVPLRISQANWYIAHLTTLNERSLETEIFSHIADDIRVRIDINLTPSTLALSSVEFMVSTTQAVFENNDSSVENAVIADLVKGDTLKLNFKFRPSSELANNVVDLALSVNITYFPEPEGNNPDGQGGNVGQFPLPISSLELLRLLMLAVPVIILYKRSKNDQISKNDFNQDEP